MWARWTREEPLILDQEITSTKYFWTVFRSCFRIKEHGKTPFSPEISLPIYVPTEIPTTRRERTFVWATKSGCNNEGRVNDVALRDLLYWTTINGVTKTMHITLLLEKITFQSSPALN